MRIIRNKYTSPIRYTVLIPSSKVEISTRKISFIFIVRLEYRTRITGSHTFPPLGKSIFRARCARAYLSKRIITTHSVYFSIGWIDMPYIGHHRRLLIKPAFRNRVLPVIAIAFNPICATLIGSKSIVRYIGIHVPHFPIGTSICRFIKIPQAIITYIGCIV